MKQEQEPRTSQEESVSTRLVVSDPGLELVQDPTIDDLIQLLSHPTNALTADEYVDSIRRRQETVDKFLLRGGSDILRRFFERIRQLEESQPIKIDLSMIEMSGRILTDLYLPGANLEKFIFTDSDISGARITAANLTAAVAPDAIMRGIVATGAKWNDAVVPDADVAGSRFVGAKFINTVMSGWKVDKDTNFAGAKFIGAYIGGIDFSVTNTAGTIFRGCRR